MFGCFYSASVSYCTTISPPGLEATTQGLLTAMYSGVGPVIGSLSGGYLYKNYGPEATFLYSGISLIGCLIIFGASQLIIKTCKRTKKSKEFQLVEVEFSEIEDNKVNAIEMEEETNENFEIGNEFNSNEIHIEQTNLES